MIKPHPPRLRMKRRKTVSVTPAMGASTVAGVIRTGPICKESGTTADADCGVRVSPGLSQNFFTKLFYLRGSGELGVEISESFLQHGPVLRVAGDLQLLENALTRKLKSLSVLLLGDLLRRERPALLLDR